MEGSGKLTSYERKICSENYVSKSIWKKRISVRFLENCKHDSFRKVETSHFTSPSSIFLNSYLKKKFKNNNVSDMTNMLLVHWSIYLFAGASTIQTSVENENRGFGSMSWVIISEYDYFNADVGVWSTRKIEGNL